MSPRSATGGILRQPAEFGHPIRPRKGTSPVQLGERGVLRPGRWLRLRVLGWFLLLFFVTAATFGIPLQAAVDRLPAGNTGAQFLGIVLACTASIGCYVVAVRVGEGRWARELSLLSAPAGLATGILLGLVMMSALMGLLIVTGVYDVTLVGAVPAWTGLGLALQAAVTEELWMRALLFRLLWRAFGMRPALIVAAVAFGALHLANPGANVLAGATVAMAGLMFCALYALTDRLWVPIGLHFAWNFAQGYLFGAAVSGNDLGGSAAISTARPGSAAWLTGGTFGPEASIFALLLISCVTVGALWSVHRIDSNGKSSHRPPYLLRQQVTKPGSQRDGIDVNRHRFDAAPFLAEDVDHPEEVPSRAARACGADGS